MVAASSPKVALAIIHPPNEHERAKDVGAAAGKAAGKFTGRSRRAPEAMSVKDPNTLVQGQADSSSGDGYYHDPRSRGQYVDWGEDGSRGGWRNASAGPSSTHDYAAGPASPRNSSSSPRQSFRRPHSSRPGTSGSIDTTGSDSPIWAMRSNAALPPQPAPPQSPLPQVPPSPGLGRGMSANAGMAAAGSSSRASPVGSIDSWRFEQRAKGVSPQRDGLRGGEQETPSIGVSMALNVPSRPPD